MFIYVLVDQTELGFSHYEDDQFLTYSLCPLQSLGFSNENVQPYLYTEI